MPGSGEVDHALIEIELEFDRLRAKTENAEGKRLWERWTAPTGRAKNWATARARREALATRISRHAYRG